MIELKPCYICKRNSARVVYTIFGFGIDCPYCPAATYLHKTIDKAAQDWNRRTNYD